jgi:hypothetical protein
MHLAIQHTEYIYKNICMFRRSGAPSGRHYTKMCTTQPANYKYFLKNMVSPLSCIILLLLSSSFD